MSVSLSACGGAEKTSTSGEYRFGEPWVVDGLFSFTILGATEIEERNEYNDENPAAVYAVDYTYTNIGHEETIGDGLYLYLNLFGVEDSEGEAGYEYSYLDLERTPEELPIGATCVARELIGVEHPGEFKLIAALELESGEMVEATFIVDPEAESAALQLPEYNGPENALSIGETWTVDGQWSFTVDGVTETEERNSFSDMEPAAVYFIDYTYTNIGCNEDLYLTPELGMIVDNAGLMGYGYSLSTSDSPESIPVGESCTAQVCIGVDHAGDFSFHLAEYDNDHEKQRQTFLVNVD